MPVLMIFVHGGSTNNFSTLHLIPITEHLFVARADFALAYGLKNIASVVSTFFSGFIIAKWGSRITAPLGLLLMGASYGFCTISGAVAVVQLWFHCHEGTVLGLVTAASWSRR